MRRASHGTPYRADAVSLGGGHVLLQDLLFCLYVVFSHLHRWLETQERTKEQKIVLERMLCVANTAYNWCAWLSLGHKVRTELKFF